MNPLGHPIFSLLLLLLEYCFNFDLTRVLVEVMGSENLQVLNKRIVIKKKQNTRENILNEKFLYFDLRNDMYLCCE